MSEQLKIEVEIARHENDNYAIAKTIYEKDKQNADFYPVFFCYLPQTKRYSAHRLTSRSLLQSFNFIIIEDDKK